MGPKKSKELSKAQWKAIWRKALKSGVCPFDPEHSLRGETCKHLDDYLQWGYTRAMFAPMPDLIFTQDIEANSGAVAVFANTQGVWNMFKALRRLGLSNVHTLLLVRKYGLKQGRRLIMRELDMRSNREFQKLVDEAVAVLRSKLEQT